MRRLALFDAVALAILLPLWLGGLALHVKQIAHGRLAHVGIYVAHGDRADGYPIVSGVWPGEEAATAAFSRNDVVETLDGHDLAGKGPIEFFALAHERLARSGNSATQAQLEVGYRRSDQLLHAPLPFVPSPYPWRMLPLTLAFVTTGTLVLVQRPRATVARGFFLSAMLFSLHWTWWFGGDRILTEAWCAVYVVVSSLMMPLMLHTALLFPETGTTRRRMPLWPWLFTINGPVALTASIGFPLPPAFGLRGVYFINVVFIVTLVTTLVRNYRAASARGKTQLKWGIFGVYAGVMPMLVSNVAILVQPAWWWMLDLSAAAEVLIPVSIFIAIVRHNLYDIDRLITATVASSVLSVLLLGVVLVLVPRVAGTVSGVMGIEPQLGATLMSLAVAVALVALYRVIGPAIDQLLFRGRVALDQGVNQFLTELGGFDSLDALFPAFGARLVELFRPMTCVIYSAGEETFTPIFVEVATRRPLAPPTLDPRGTLVAAVRDGTGPLRMEDWRRNGSARFVAGDDLAALETLRPAVIAPVGNGTELSALVALGSKRSGEAFEPGDIAVLTALCDKLHAEITRIDRARRTASAPVLVPRKYEIVDEIGRGGMGRVYKVRHQTLGATMAMKLLSDTVANQPDALERFHREARVMAQLQHPNIVRVFDVESEGDSHYFVMEYVAGRSLSAIVRDEGPLSLPRVLTIMHQVCDALSYAHRANPPVIHRDVKPANILIEDATARAVLTDFGIAKIAGPDGSLTRSGEVFGTLRYCAPEQLRGARDLDARADVYAVGMVFYELLTGRHLLASLNESDLIARVLWNTADLEVEASATCPEACRGIIARAVAKDRDRRHPDLATFIAELAALDGRETPVPTSAASVTVNATAAPAADPEPETAAMAIPPDRTAASVLPSAPGAASDPAMDGDETVEHPSALSAALAFLAIAVTLFFALTIYLRR